MGNKVKIKRENVASDTDKTAFDLNKTEKISNLIIVESIINELTRYIWKRHRKKSISDSRMQKEWKKIGVANAKYTTDR